jgi:diguanylate cyclase (GGDEF)-like protein
METAIDNRIIEKKPKILVIDDSESILFLLKNVLSIDFEVFCVNNAKNALDIIDISFDIVIIDLMMPEMGGIDFIKIIKANEKLSFIPIIVLTAKHNTEDDIAKLFELGANDYISKPFFSTELIARIKTHTRLKLITEGLMEANKKLVFSATHDDLTKVYNRHAIFNFLENDILRIKRTNENLSIIMFDIDYFKEINDTYGHLAGDNVLCRVVQIVKDTIREIDLIGRYGGDEFIIILPNTKLKRAKDIAKRILTRIEDEKYDNIDMKITLSIGLSEYVNGETLDKFIEKVDKALYEAKESGKNCIKFK